MAADDRITAALAEIRERWAKIATIEVKPDIVPHGVGERARPEDWRTDIPRLLAALKAALGDHGNDGVFLGADDCGHPEPSDTGSKAWGEWDDDHPHGLGDVGRICLLTETGRYCPACTRLVYEDDPVGDSYVDASNCIVLPAISAALLGEGGGGG